MVENNSNEMEIYPGTPCTVFNKKGVSIKEVYYGYELNGSHYFYNTKTEAISSGRSGAVVIGTRKAQNYRRFKIND